MTEIKDIQNDWDEARRDINRFLNETIVPCLNEDQKKSFENTMNKIFKEINEDIQKAYRKGKEETHELFITWLSETGRFTSEELDSVPHPNAQAEHRA